MPAGKNGFISSTKFSFVKALTLLPLTRSKSFLKSEESNFSSSNVFALSMRSRIR